MRRIVATLALLSACSGAETPPAEEPAPQPEEPVRLELDPGGLEAVALRKRDPQLRRRASCPEGRDLFETAPRPRADVLLVVDDSPSMLEEQAALPDEARAFVEAMLRADVDFRVTVVRTDLSGDLVVEGRTHAGAADPASDLASLIAVGRSGSDETEGFRASAEALSEIEGLVRPGARLAVVVLSDGDDRSPGSVDQWHTRLTSLAAGAVGWSFSAVTGGSDGCASSTGDAAPSPRYLELAVRTGVHESICGAWGAALVDPGTRDPARSGERFLLTQRPLPETLEVRIDGAVLPEADATGTVLWGYDDEDNALLLSPYADPPPAALVEVTYELACP